MVVNAWICWPTTGASVQSGSVDVTVKWMWMNAHQTLASTAPRVTTTSTHTSVAVHLDSADFIVTSTTTTAPPGELTCIMYTTLITCSLARWWNSLCEFLDPRNGPKSIQTLFLFTYSCSVVIIFRPPVYGSNGRSYKMLVMFFFLSPGSLRAPSTDRPETLPHDRKLVRLDKFRPKIRGALPPPKKKWGGGQKHAKFRSILDHFRL